MLLDARHLTPRRWDLDLVLDRRRTASGPCRIPVRLETDEAHPVPLSIFLQKRKGSFAQFAWPEQGRGYNRQPLHFRIPVQSPYRNRDYDQKHEKMFFNTMNLHEHDPHDKSGMEKVRNERRQQRLVQYVDKFLTSTAPASVVDIVIGQSVVLTSHVLRTRINQGSAPTNEWDSATVSLENEYILPVERPKKRQCMASSAGATQPRVDLIPTTPRKRKPNLCNRSVSPPSSAASFFDDIKRDFLPVGCTTEAYLEERVLMD